MIGGRVEIGENSENTIKREIKEELGKDIEITGYLGTIENFFEMKGNKYHEIMFVYKIEFVNEEDKCSKELAIEIAKDIEKNNRGVMEVEVIQDLVQKGLAERGKGILSNSFSTSSGKVSFIPKPATILKISTPGSFL